MSLHISDKRQLAGSQQLGLGTWKEVEFGSIQHPGGQWRFCCEVQLHQRGMGLNSPGHFYSSQLRT